MGKQPVYLSIDIDVLDPVYGDTVDDVADGSSGDRNTRQWRLDVS